MIARLIVLVVFFLYAGLAQAAPVAGQGTWETTLRARDVDGNGLIDAYFDTVLGITWLRDARAQGPVGPFGDGRVAHSEASQWAASLVVGGVAGWRLPRTLVGPDATFPPGIYTYAGPGWFSELGHMFYVTLGNLGACAPDTTMACNPQAGSGLTNTGVFDSLWPGGLIWSDTEWSQGSGYFWYLLSDNGEQGWRFQSHEMLAWAVHDGDVGLAVDEPDALLLVLSGLCATALARRRKLASST